MAIPVCIISYNSRGFNDCKKDFVKDLVKVAGCEAIICNQENFVLKKNEYTIEQTLPGHKIIFKPAVKKSLDGRPKNGMFIAIPRSLNILSIKDVSPDSFMIQSVLINIGACKLLLLNTYFPTDPGSDFDENELLLMLSDVEKVIESSQFDKIILTGDINADFKRNTKFVDLIRDFLTTWNFQKSWDSYEVDFTHVTERDGKTFNSTIDHFFWNDGFGECVQDAGALHLPENMSDHEPVFCKFQLPVTESRESTGRPMKKKLPSWKKADDAERASFISELSSRLENIDLPQHTICCRNVKCEDSLHIKHLDYLMTQVLSALEEAARTNLPIPEANSGKMRIPDWKEDVAPLKENAHFWHSVWVSAGKPINCYLHVIMKKTRNRYHLVLRKKKRMVEISKRNTMLQSCLSNDNDIFAEIKKIRKSPQTSSGTIDGITEDIPDYLASRYEKLYNGVDDKTNLLELEAFLDRSICEQSQFHVNQITAEVVKKSALKLKPGKTDPVMSITSDCLINAPDYLYQILAVCMRSYIIHGHVSKCLLTSTMVPLIKDKLGDSASSDNYRSIAISSVIMKIFDLVILSVFGEHLQLDELQFGYQPEISTTMCTWLAVETISHFLRNGSEVYTCLMDMSKAFDRVQHSLLFKKLLDQGMPPIIVRFILVSYKRQSANVRWNGVTSRRFDIGNGVKQGAIISAVLYCVYTNGLFDELRRMKVGCCIGRDFVGVLGYADDLFLLSPTLDGLQDMLKVCEQYAKKYNLAFSTNENPNKSKTKCMAFLHKERELRRLKLCGNDLPWVQKGKHLGVKIENKKNRILNGDIMEKRACYIQRNNELMQEFWFTHSSTKAFINRVYNSHFYGSVLWNLFEKEAGMLYNTWSVSVRKMFGLDRRTHRYLVEPVSDMPHIKMSLMQRFVGFTRKLSSSRKAILRNAFEVFKTDCRSTTGFNLRTIMLECNMSTIDSLSQTAIKGLEFRPTPKEDEWRIHIIRDLLEIREGLKTEIGWSSEDLSHTLEFLTTT